MSLVLRSAFNVAASSPVIPNDRQTLALKSKHDLLVDFARHNHCVDFDGFFVGVAASEAFGRNYEFLFFAQLGGDFGYFDAAAVDKHYLVGLGDFFEVSRLGLGLRLL